MKNKLRNLITNILRKEASFILKRQQPQIIAITGSVGKTSIRQAVAKILEHKYHLYTPVGNYNSEIGTPLAILGTRTPGSLLNIFGWLGVFAYGLFQAFNPKYPKLLVLELGVDQPGDMDYLMSFIEPDVVIITAITPVHMANFTSFEQLETEKLKLVAGAKKLVIFNKEQVGLKGAKVPVLSYGRGGDVSGTEIKVSVEGTTFKVINGSEVADFKTDLLGEHSVLAILAAVACGDFYGIKLKDAVRYFTDYQPSPGCMNSLQGFNGSFIIDDTYNASPEGVRAALKTTDSFSSRRIVALGSMNELGSLSEKEHREIGALAANVADILITVGVDANNFLADEAVQNGFKKENVYKFLSSREAGRFLRTRLQKGDIVLVKGSQNKVFMEELTKEILADSQDVSRLVRQSASWLAKKEKFFRSN